MYDLGVRPVAKSAPQQLTVVGSNNWKLLGHTGRTVRAVQIGISDEFQSSNNAKIGVVFLVAVQCKRHCAIETITVRFNCTCGIPLVN